MSRVWTRLLLMAGLLLCAASPRAAESRLIDFEIKDQFKQKHRDEDYRGRILVVIGSDRHASDFNAAWGKALSDSLGEERAAQIDWLAVADTRGVPFFIKGMVRGKFPKDRAKWALTDWDGVFAKAYDWQEKNSNIVVFDAQGKVVAQHAGAAVQAESVEVLCEVLKRLLDEDIATTAPSSSTTIDPKESP